MIWQEELKNSLRTADDLVRAGFLSAAEAPKLSKVFSKYQFFLPRYYASLIDKGNPACPIGLQALPVREELDLERNLTFPDPLQDLAHQPVARVTHRFSGRVLLHLTPNCSMYCRFCFRKTLLNELKKDLFGGELEEAFSYIDKNKIEEVIFSGGDPLLASDAQIASVVKKLGKIQTVRRIRFHTRVPVTFPMRVTNELVAALKTAGKRTVIVIHFNHPKELTSEAFEAAKAFQTAGFLLLNQSVLLKGVNDSFETLAELSRKLIEFGILPYYLHQLDQASGTSHFEVSVEEGRKIYMALKENLSGYLVPRYVVDKVGEKYKSDLDS